MPVTDDQVAVLRAFLGDDGGELDRRRERLQQAGEWDGCARLFAAAFALAASRRFGPGWSAGDVIRFVATARARYGRNADDIDPRGAEHLVHAALGDRPATGLDEAARAAQIPLLNELIADEQFDGAGLEAFLAAARAQADRAAG